MPINRRRFLKLASTYVIGSAIAQRLLATHALADSVTLPFENGERELIAYPQKTALMRLTSRPPQLETPFCIFNESVITPNDAFFVRYHLSGIPTEIDPANYRINIHGLVSTPLSLSLADLKQIADPVDLIAVNQCSGNSRGFFSPRVPGGQLGNGAMGNARWTGIPLNKILKKAGLLKGAKQVSFKGLDTAPLAATPAFIKALDIDHALDGEVMIAFAMNGEDIPMLNGFPVKLIVPGYYGTYWIKHLTDIEVIDHTFDGFWMKTAYRIPDNPEHAVAPGQVPAKTIPINRMNVRSFITSLSEGSILTANRETILKGIAFDGGEGIKTVLVSTDAGKSWKDAFLDKDHGRYSFREWKLAFTPPSAGQYTLLVRAVNKVGATQPSTPLWNPPGYMRNVTESLHIRAV